MYPAKFILILPVLNSAMGHKCYVCGPDNEKPEDILQLKRNFPDRKIPLCSGYKSSLQHDYLIDCPEGSNGCLTKFEDDGSIMRTCAKIGIDDCKEANSVNYCYCSKEGCNTPERILSSPSSSDWRSSSVSAAAGGMRPRQGHEIDFSAPRIQQRPPIDDEDGLGSGDGEDDWGTFYYDSYYETVYDDVDAAGNNNNNRMWHYDDVDGVGGGSFTDFIEDDTEVGGDDGDITEPPPFIQQEIDAEVIIPVHKFDRGGGGDEPENEIVFVEETVRPASGGQRAGHLPANLPHLAVIMVTMVNYVLS